MVTMGNGPRKTDNSGHWMPGKQPNVAYGRCAALAGERRGVRFVKMLPVHSTMDQPSEALSVSGHLWHGVWAAPSS